MPKRELLLLIALACVLGLSSLVAPSASHAIGKTTPTPSMTEIPEELDVEKAVEDLLALLEKQEYHDAIRLADRVLQADAESWQAHYYRGFARVRLDRLEEAISDYDAVLELRPWDSGFWRLRGELHLKNSDPRQAKSDYKQSLFYNPRALQTYVSLASLHERDVDKAIYELYQAIVKAGQASAQGASSRASDTLTEAIDSFDRGKLPAELGYAYFFRAENWTGEENREKALDDLAVALELQPEMHDYYLARGAIYSETEQAVLAGIDFYRRMTLLERESIEETIDFSESVTVEMTHGLVERLRFAGEAGQRITIAARDFLGSGVDPLLVLLDPAGEPLTGNDDGGGEQDALISNYELPVEGIYTAVISRANGGYEGKIRVSLR